MDTPIAPTDPIVAEMVNALDGNLREEFEERAAIVEFDANLPRAHAECLALLCVLRRNPDALVGVTALRVDRDGATRWLLTTSLEAALERLAGTKRVEMRVVPLEEAVRIAHGGLALLAPFE